MKNLFAEIEPYNTFRVNVSGGHNLYVEQVGNPNGQPILFLHGGPGAGLSPKHRRFFDPTFYRIILFDQRGAGQSTPHASLDENTTWDLISDIEAIRTRLNISSWVVFGGSWGSTLALAYAETHPDKVRGLILRGIFLCRDEEIRWFYQEGAHHIFPDFWEEYVAPIPKEKRHDFVTAFYEQLTDSDPKIRSRAAKAWSGWEGRTIKLIPDPEAIADFSSDLKSQAIARIECHYFKNKSFFEPDQLINNVSKIRHIPAVLVHGRYDIVCPVKNAWDLHAVWPEARLEIVPDSGHAADEPGIIDALIRATNEFQSLYKRD